MIWASYDEDVSFNLLPSTVKQRIKAKIYSAGRVDESNSIARYPVTVSTAGKSSDSY